VEGWLGAYTSYADAIAHGVTAIGMSAEFLNSTGDPTQHPPTPPVNTTGWDGNLILAVPEPGTLALAALSVAGIWMFRRNQHMKD